ncbi:YjjG family noncanonical pyrimidine nucleotidase [Leptobacterium sp. I13]|uniref:YjjG family noncanonical pyrimidine nucleotidase n=1 Tax=Leptobacterium meishanense TaxID=3128904 RepID=UPI0030ECC5A3
MKDIVTDVFFDLDHTLWDFEKNSAITFNKILKTHKVNLKVQEFLEAYAPINFKYWKAYREEKIPKEVLRYKRLKDTFDEFSYKIDDELIHILSDEYIKELPHQNHLFNNTIVILEYLKNSGYDLHIITNGFEEVQEGKLRKAAIMGFFTHVINSEMVGVKKPNPKIFEFALEKAIVDPEKSVMIGDSLEADIIGAKNVGMHTIHFNSNKEKKHDHCIIVDDLIEIKEFL